MSRRGSGRSPRVPSGRFAADPMPNMGKVLHYKQSWHWGPETDKWLKSICVGRTLNFPCGKSIIGDVRADIDPRVLPDVFADLFHCPFRHQSFDTVICDPPFRYFNRFKWLLPISSLARKVFIICTPQVFPMLKHFREELHATRYTGSFFIRNWVVFYREQEALDNWLG